MTARDEHVGAADAAVFSCPSAERELAGCSAARTTLVRGKAEGTGGASLRVSYLTPADALQFGRHFHEVHLPLVTELPGLRHITLDWNASAGDGPACHLVATLEWESAAELRVALDCREILLPAESMPAESMSAEFVPISNPAMRGE